jgi:GAF domain-containing protein
VWVRWCVVLVAFVGIVLDAAGSIGAFEEPAFGFNTTAVGIAALSRGEFVQLTEIIPGGPMDEAGLRVGDRVRVVRGDLGELTGASENATTAVHFEHADGRVVAVRRARLHEYPSAIALALIGIGLAALAIVLALRGWHGAQARWLAIGMAWEAYAWIPTIDTSAPITVLQNYGAIPIMGVGTWALVAFATGWLATPAALARVLRWAAAGFAIVFTGATIAANALGAVGGRGVGNVGLAAWSMCAALIVAGLITSVWHARGIERRRIGWICVTTAVAFTPWIVFVLMEALAGTSGLDVPLWVVVPTAVFPIGYGYSILRRDIVDVGFALNRAAVFAATTALLVGSFGALQWAADQLLVQIVGRHDFLVQMTIAVIVLYVVRALRAQTDAFVTRVFFASRERRIAAIRTLAAEVDAVSTAEAIAPFVVDRLRAVAGIATAVYVEDDEGFARVAGAIGSERSAPDAPTVVALRASLAPVRIDAGNDLGGAMIFPLAVRGRLRGGLACAYPAGDDDFAPDEAAALAALASRIAIARDDLMAQSLHTQTTRLTAERDALTERLVALERENALLTRLAGMDEAGRSATSPFALE